MNGNDDTIDLSITELIAISTAIELDWQRRTTASQLRPEAVSGLTEALFTGRTEIDRVLTLRLQRQGGNTPF